MANEGIRYRETYPIHYVSSDESEYDKAYYEVDFNNKKTTIYNKDFGLYRDGLVSEIVSIPVGEVWNQNETTMNPVIKKEYLNHISEEPKISVNVEFDRGNATAFENHFKLLECNTFEDMENYGNNFFNL